MFLKRREVLNKIEKILKELEKFNYIRFESKYHSYFSERYKFKNSVTGTAAYKSFAWLYTVAGWTIEFL